MLHLTQLNSSYHSKIPLIMFRNHHYHNVPSLPTSYYIDIIVETGMTHKAHKTLVDAQKSAAIKRHIKIFMLILTHLLPVFGFKMTSLENFTKWNCSQRMTRMSLYEAQIFLQNLIFLTNYHHCYQKSFPDHLRRIISSFPSHFVFEFF